MAALTNRQFAGLLKRAARLAAEKAAVQQELSEAFRARYGVTYSDVDADWIIDELDYGGGETITVARSDEEMTICGYPPLDTGKSED